MTSESRDIEAAGAFTDEWPMALASTHIENLLEIIKRRDQACRAMAREIERMKANETATKEHRRNDNREMVIPNVVSDVL